MSGPLGCVAAVTYRCNSRCTMCDIWRTDARAGDELEPEAYRWLPDSLTSINVSGGEPYLRDDLPEVVSVMRDACPRARIVVSTNGLTPERITGMTARMPGVAVRVSLDAAGPLHDEIRGIEGAYESVLETVRLLKDSGVEDLGLAATSTEAHADELLGVKSLADELGIRFIASAAHSSPIFFGDHESERPHSEKSARAFGRLMREDLNSPRPRDWARAYYWRGVVDYVRGRPRRLGCGAGTYFFFLDPWGDVYPCNVGGTRMGNIRDGSFAELRRRTRNEVGEAVANCPHQCWMVCTVTPPMRRRPLGPIAWIAGAKLFGIGRGSGR
ncbi:MAG: radical SAM protein [Candidatus Eisenbacteria bacterium]|nr:radical SAM protein [Candidatus Eisenbacteria bacterium]